MKRDSVSAASIAGTARERAASRFYVGASSAFQVPGAAGGDHVADRVTQGAHQTHSNSVSNKAFVAIDLTTGRGGNFLLEYGGECGRRDSNEQTRKTGAGRGPEACSKVRRKQSAWGTET